LLGFILLILAMALRGIFSFTRVRRVEPNDRTTNQATGLIN